MDPVQMNEDEFRGHEPEPVADVIALPQLERLPADPDLLESGVAAGFTADSRSARLEALELVRAAVELADRIERDAQETAKDRLTRTEEEIRLRRLALDEREHELDHLRRDLEAARQELTRAEQELDRQRQQTAEALHQADALVAAARGDAEAAAASVHTEAEEALARARAEAGEIAQGARSAADELLERARAEAAGISEAARREAEELRAIATAADARPEAEPVQVEQPASETAEGVEPEPELYAVGDVAGDAQQPGGAESPAGGFTPPPSSLEDLAAASRATRFSIRNR